MAISQDCSEFQENLGEFETFYRRFPRRFAPRNDKAEALCHTEDTPMFSPCLPSETSGWTGFSPARFAKTKCTAQKAGRSACRKVPSGLLPSCLQNCKTFCSTVLQFCRCGGLLNAKGNPDGFLSHFSSLRNLRLGSFFASPFRKNEMYRPASRTVHFEEKKEREREKKEKKHEKERGCDLWKTSDQGRGLSCSDGSSALADVVGSSFCTASSLLSNTMGRRNVLP